MVRRAARSGGIGQVDGFSVPELLVTVSVAAVLMAVAVPTFRHSVDQYRLSMATREVERELQTARLRAVSANTPMRVRLNCPAAGQFRMVEITGVATTDTAANRCDETAFPYPSPRDTDRATPEHDGPVRRLHPRVAVAGVDLVFYPNGTVRQWVAGQLQPITGEASVTLTQGPKTSTVSVNALGKIRIQ
jgi:prepilin-type N-terminal cleavage/methylation domain-containing protein